jgi:5'-3' exonuclease
MAREMVSVETKPYTLSINQIRKITVSSGNPKNVLDKLTDNLKERGFNSVLPVACLTDNEDEYQLLTGLPIYEAAKSAGLRKIWVFLVAAHQAEASQWVEQNQMLSRLNETVVEPQNVNDFLKFINDSNSDLVSIKGIGPKIAKKIIANRSYDSLEDVQKKFGRKRPLNWIRAFKQK